MQLRPAVIGDLSTIEKIRERAFSPVFASFRQILGTEIYELAQKREDEAQAQQLGAIFLTDSPWEVHIASHNNEIIGFVSIKLDHQVFIGEIGLNAVDPDWAGQGLGVQMYEYALRLMRQVGMKVAVVASGADVSHAAAQRAYQKAGFSVGIPSVWMCCKL
jgi:GNAT superfamily N-acetyltransferase